LEGKQNKEVGKNCRMMQDEKDRDFLLDNRRMDNRKMNKEESKNR
jgi:hypothetical protein